MEDSIAYNDENKQQTGKKRQQIESPFTAATPKSRVGKEPKRLFGQLHPNLADSNLEETCMESDSRPCSAASSDLTFDMSNVSRFDEVDPNLEQTQLIAAGTSANSTKDLSMVEESDETDADVTLANYFDDKMNVGEDRSTPTAPREPLSPIFSRDTDGTPTAPTALASKIERGIESIASHSSSILSPVHHPKSHIDYSLHEFEILEQKIEHEEDVKDLHTKIDELREQHKLEIIEIQDSRMFEEKMLTQRMEAAIKMEKSVRAAAKETELLLENRIKEQEAKIQESDDQKKQLESQLAELSSRVDELTEKALQVDSMRHSATSYEARIRELEVLELETNNQLTKARTEIESLQIKNTEVEEMIKTKAEMVESDPSAKIAELESEHEEVRKMMMEEIKSLENQLSIHQSQQSLQEREQKLSESQETKIQELTTALDESERQRSKDNDTLKCELQLSETKVQELTSAKEVLTTQLNALREESGLTEVELSAIQTELDEARQELVLASEAAEEKIKSLEMALEINLAFCKQLEDSSSDNLKQLEIAQAELNASRQETSLHTETKEQYKVELTTAELQIQELIASMESLPSELKSAQEETLALQNKIEELEAALESSQTTKDSLEAAVLKIKHLETVQAELETVHQEFTANNLINHNIQEQLNSAESKVQEVSDALNTVRTELDTARQELVSSETKVKELEVSLELTQETIVSNDLKYSEKVQELEAQLELAQKSIESNNDLKIQLENSEGAYQELKSSVDSLTVERDMSRQKEQELDTLKSSMELMKEEYAAERNALSAELELVQQHKEGAIQDKSSLEKTILELQNSLDSLQQVSECQKNQDDLELKTARQENEQLMHQIEELRSSQEAIVARLTAQITETEQKSLDVEPFRTQVSELTVMLENAQAEFVGAEQIHQAKMQELREQVENVQKKFEEQKEKIEEAGVKVQRRDEELVKQALKHKEQVDQLQADLDERIVSKNLGDESKIVELNSCIEDLQAKFTLVESAKKEKDVQLQSVYEQMEKLKKDMEEEKSCLERKLQQDLDMVNERLEVAQQVLSQKENKIVTYESQIETMTKHFEERLGEANEWKAQAKHIGSMTESLNKMQQQLREVTEKLEASESRQEMAQHDLTIVQDENKEQSAALEEAKAKIAQLEEKLNRSEKEAEHYRKMCDDFDDDEKEFNDQISQLQAEIKMLKGIKSPPKPLGLLQKARLGIKPLSRENTHMEAPTNEDGFEDAHDSFQTQAQQVQQKSFNQTAREMDTTRATAAGTTILHPDDQAAEKSTVETPSKKANRSNCQQQ